MKSAITVFLAASLVLVSACSKTGREPVTGKVAVTFSVDPFVSDAAKSKFDPQNHYAITWAQGDTIGVFPKGGYQMPFSIPQEQIGQASVSFDGGYWDMADGIKYNAYYPFSSVLFGKDASSNILMNTSAQEQYGHSCNAGSYDIVFSDWVEAKDGNAHFRFHHARALYVVKLKLPETGTYSMLDLCCKSNSLPSSGYLDLNDENPHFIPTGHGRLLRLLLREFQGEKDEMATFYLMLNPMTITSSYHFELCIGNEYYNYQVPRQQIEAGRLYEVEAELK